MAVITRKVGSASAHQSSGGRAVTVLGHQPFLATSADALAPTQLEPGEQLHVAALMAHTRRTWADRLAGEEAMLKPEAAPGFAARLGAEFHAEREQTLAGLPRRLRAHAASGLGTIGAEIVDAARDYEGFAARIGLFNSARRATDDIAAMITHDRTAHDRLRDQGLALLATTPLSGGARTLLGQRHVTALAHAHAAAHIDDDPADAYAALTATEGEGPLPYDVLSDEQRQRYAARALTEDARRRATARFVEIDRLEAAIEAGGASQADITASGLLETDKRELMVLLGDRMAEEQAVATAEARFLDGARWNSADPQDQADANRIWSSRGGNVDALVQQDRRSVLLLRRIARRTGIVPERARHALEIIASTGTVQQREFADALLRSATDDASLAEPLNVLDGASSFESDVQVVDDFELTDEEMALVSRETPLAELAAWLRELRALNDLGADDSHDQTASAAKKTAFRERIYRSFAGRDETMRLLHDRYRKVAGDMPDIHGHAAMFPAEFSARVGPSLDRRAELFGGLLDLMPVVGDLKAAAELAEILGDLHAAIERGDEIASDDASEAFYLKLTDLFPGPNIVRLSRKVMRKLDGLSLPKSFKRKVREIFEERGMLDEREWVRRRQAQTLRDNEVMGDINETNSARRFTPQELKNMRTGVGVRTGPRTMRYIDKIIFADDGMAERLIEDKTPTLTGKLRKKTRQRLGDEAIERGEGTYTSDHLPFVRRGDRVTGKKMEYQLGEPSPTGWKKIWRLRIRKK